MKKNLLWICIALGALSALGCAAFLFFRSSPVPFMSERGICVDSLIMDTIPQPEEGRGVLLNNLQAKALYGKYALGNYDIQGLRILAVKPLVNAFFVALGWKERREVSLVLYAADGTPLDKVDAGLWGKKLTEKSVKYVEKLFGIDCDYRAGNCTFTSDTTFFVTRSFVKANSSCITRYYYRILHGQRIKLLRIRSNFSYGENTAMLTIDDVFRYPFTDIYSCCNLYNRYLSLPQQGCGLPYAPWATLNIYWCNPPAMWLWIYNHRNDERKRFLALSLKTAYIFNVRHPKVNASSIDVYKQAIVQLKNSKVRTYLLNMIDIWVSEKRECVS